MHNDYFLGGNNKFKNRILAYIQDFFIKYPLKGLLKIQLYTSEQSFLTNKPSKIHNINLSN